MTDQFDQMPDLRSMALGEALVALHDGFRARLRHIRALAEAPDMPRDAPLGADLREHCLTFCERLHDHHAEEDGSLFPHLRGLDPSLSDVLDRLGKEHRVIAVGIRELQGVLDAHDHAEPGAQRTRLRARMRQIAHELEAHLDYEEEQLVPLLNTMPTLPGTAEGS
jgi:hemerythrin-like domain-containing protein